MHRYSTAILMPGKKPTSNLKNPIYEIDCYSLHQHTGRHVAKIDEHKRILIQFSSDSCFSQLFLNFYLYFLVDMHEKKIIFIILGTNKGSIYFMTTNNVDNGDSLINELFY